MSRDEYTADDVEDYFNYMGMLAAEVSSYPKLWLLGSGVPKLWTLLHMDSSVVIALSYK